MTTVCNIACALVPILKMCLFLLLFFLLVKCYCHLQQRVSFSQIIG